MEFDINCATPQSPTSEDESRQVILGVSRQSWHILPQLEILLEQSKITQEPRDALIAQQPEVVISFDSGEQRNEVDQLQSNSKTLAADFVRAFGLEDRPEDLYSK